jgi:hypothetical protein
MDHSYTSNEFLFSFKGRINRAKYWYAAFASGISCLFFLFVLALVLGGMFGVASKSVHVSIDIFEIFNNPPSFPLRASFSNPPASAAFLPVVQRGRNSDHARRHLVLYGYHGQAASRS